MTKTRSAKSSIKGRGFSVKGGVRFRLRSAKGLLASPPELIDHRKNAARSPSGGNAQNYALGDWEKLGAPLLATYPPPGDIRESLDARIARATADPAYSPNARGSTTLWVEL